MTNFKSLFTDMDNRPDFIIVDDDPVNNEICIRVIRSLYPSASIVAFTDPTEGLRFVEENYAAETPGNTILFLDINMPGLNGWDFMDKFAQLDAAVRGHLSIYMLTSSINPIDRARAGSNANIWDFIQKPLTLRTVEQTMAGIREEERATLSREIHDELGQKLVRIKMDVSWVQRQLGDSNPALTDRLSSAAALVDETVLSIRRINSGLRPRILDDLGLVEALEWEAAEFTRLHGIPLRLDILEEDGEFSKTMSLNIYRIFQEILANIYKHAQATQVQARLSRTGNVLTLTVIDNGIGIKRTGGRTFGIIGMQERAGLIGGNLQISAPKKGGTRVELRVPVL